MSNLASEYRRTQVRPDQEPLQGVDAWVQDAIGWVKGRLPVLERLAAQADTILALAEPLKALSDEALDEQLRQCRARVRCGATNRTEVVNQGFALVVEAAERTLRMRPFKVQLMAALALHYRYVAEMLPGEGKTLTASLPATLAGWTGRPCHVVTANDYLASRDAELIRPLYNRCGVSVGCVTGEMKADERRANYLNDVVYATSKELLADFLRDQMAMNGVTEPDRRLIQSIAGRGKTTSQPVLRGLDTAIVDEADSVLADEATTPLIISVPGENRLLKEASLAARTLVQKLEKGVHYLVDERYHEVRLTEAGEHFIESLTDDLPPLWRGPTRRQDLLRQALLAHEFNQRDKHYVIHEGKIVIVDEKTGRMMPGRSWSYGLHQAIEAKEGVELSDPTETHARLSFQRFFRLYRNLAGMSGTLQGIEGELWRIYGLPIVRIPPRVPSRRQILPDRMFTSSEKKWQAIEAEIERMHTSGRPILVGTRSITDSERLAESLRQRGLDCLVLNARRQDEEAQIIALAGKAGRITIATNMAGRGTDILLDKGVAELGGLHVIATERFESSRVDWQLFGRCARQGQPGSAQAFISIDDELLKRHSARHWSQLLHTLLRRNHHKLAHRGYLLIQKRVEASGSRLRKQMLNKDLWLSDMLSFAGKNNGANAR